MHVGEQDRVDRIGRDARRSEMIEQLARAGLHCAAAAGIDQDRLATGSDQVAVD